MNAFEKTIQVEDNTYVFKLPSSKDIIEIDLEALGLRNGVTDGLGSALQASYNSAFLKKLCKTPSDVNFSELPMYIVDYLADEVAKWANSFRQRLSATKTGTDQGSN